MPFLFTNLQLTLLQDLLYYVVDTGLWSESLGKVLCGRCLPFADGKKDVGNLEDVIEVGLDTTSVFEDLVLVAGDLEAFFTFFQTDE